MGVTIGVEPDGGGVSAGVNDGSAAWVASGVWVGSGGAWVAVSAGVSEGSGDASTAWVGVGLGCGVGVAGLQATTKTAITKSTMLA